MSDKKYDYGSFNWNFAGERTAAGSLCDMCIHNTGAKKCYMGIDTRDGGCGHPTTDDEPTGYEYYDEGGGQEALWKERELDAKVNEMLNEAQAEKRGRRK